MSSNSGPVSSSGSSSSCTSKFSVEDVIAKAQVRPLFLSQLVFTSSKELAGRFEYDLAIQFYLKALELSPENSQVLDALGALYGEVGNHELAVQVSFFFLMDFPPFCETLTAPLTTKVSHS